MDQYGSKFNRFGRVAVFVGQVEWDYVYKVLEPPQAIVVFRLFFGRLTNQIERFMAMQKKTMCYHVICSFLSTGSLAHRQANSVCVSMYSQIPSIIFESTKMLFAISSIFFQGKMHFQEKKMFAKLYLIWVPNSLSQSCTMMVRNPRMVGIGITCMDKPFIASFGVAVSPQSSIQDLSRIIKFKQPEKDLSPNLVRLIAVQN